MNGPYPILPEHPPLKICRHPVEMTLGSNQHSWNKLSLQPCPQCAQRHIWWLGKENIFFCGVVEYF